MVPRRGPAAPLRPGPGALWPAGRRSVGAARAARGVEDAAFAVYPGEEIRPQDAEAMPVNARATPTETADPRPGGVEPAGAFDARFRAGSRIVARWPTGALPKDLPALHGLVPLGFGALVEGDDFVVERPDGCPDEPIETWLVANPDSSRVHPTANRPLHRFIVVGGDVGDTVPAGSEGAGGFSVLDAVLVRMMLDIAAPNGTLAVRSADGRLVYAKSITWVTWYQHWFASADLQTLPEGEHLEYLVKADGTNRISVTSPCSSFRWASVTKPLVAMAAVAMAATPHIDITLNSPVFPQRVGALRAPWQGFYSKLGVMWAATGQSPRAYGLDLLSRGGAALPDIRLLHLLTHTAGWSDGHRSDFSATTLGVNNYEAAKGEAATSMRTFPLDPPDPLRWQLSPPSGAGDPDAQSVLDQLAAGTAYPAGTARLYSNTGYTLLGQLLAYAAGDSLHRTMQRWVFGPCGMAHARLADRCTLAERRAGDPLFFATADAGDFRSADAATDGWDALRESFTTSRATLEGEVVNYTGSRPEEWWPYGPSDERLSLGAVGLRATASDLTRFGHAMGLNNGTSPLLNFGHRALVWLFMLPTTVLPSPAIQRSNAIGFNRSLLGSGSTPTYLDHSGAWEGCAAYLFISGEGNNRARSGLPPDDGFSAALSFNRRRSFYTGPKGGRRTHYPSNPQATLRAALGSTHLRLAMQTSMGDLDHAG